MSTSSNARFNAEAAAWDKNLDVHRATQSALEAVLRRFPELEERRASGNVRSEGPRILEIGCGTGLLTLSVAPYARSILAVDASTGMIDALNLKLADGGDGLSHITPLCVMLEDAEDPRLPAAAGAGDEGMAFAEGAHGRRFSVSGDGAHAPRLKFDLVLSHLVLHHIPAVEPLLRTMYACLKKGGCVALTDFEDFGPEARRFHPEAKMEGVERDGIERGWFERALRGAGFARVEVGVGWKMMKEVEKVPGEWVGGKKPEGVELQSMEFPFLMCVGWKD